MAKQRIEYIDIMKGLGIIFVVLQHYRWLPAEDHSIFNRILLTCLMPMFFFVAGLFIPYKGSFSQMISRSLKNLILPWIVFITLGIILVDVMCGSPMNYIPNKILFTTNVPLWFLRAMAIAVMLGWILAVTCRRRLSRYMVFIILAAISIAAFPMSDYFHTLSDINYFFIYASTIPELCSLMVFLWVGHILACEADVSKLVIPKKTAALIFAAASILAIGLNPDIIRWHHVIYTGSPIRIWLSAWCGIAAFFAAAHLLKSVRPLAIVGSCTLIILGFHYIPLQMTERLWNMPRHQAAWFSIVVSAIAVIAVLYIRKKENKSL